LTEVSVNELEPTPVVVLEDMVTLVAVMVKSGVEGGADEPNTTVLHVKRNPRTASRQYLCMARPFCGWMAPSLRE
jgi:hypothetical protein